MAVIDSFIADDYALYNGDSAEVIQDLPDESIHMSLYSPPFGVDSSTGGGGALYHYSSSERDLSNARTYSEFFKHYEFIVRELYRLTPPGRMSGVHCCDVPLGGANLGHGLSDFPGDIIRLHRSIGWQYCARYHVWKEPLAVRNRTMAKGLAHKTVVDDSALCDVAGADYLLMFRKTGENKVPIAHPVGLMSYAGSRKVPADLLKYRGWKGDQTKNRYSHWIWRNYASAFWEDVRIDRVLPYKESREPEDERHCLSAGSLVLTRMGYLPIESVNIGDEVLTHRGRWKPVVAKHMNGVREVVQVKAQGVPFLRLTSDHLLWCRSGTGPGRWNGMAGSNFHPRERAAKNTPEWIQSGETKTHYLNLPLPPIEHSSLSENDWWIIGRWLGDGYLDVRGYPHIACSIKELSSLVVALGIRAGHQHQSNRSTMSVALKDSEPVIGVSSGRRTTIFTEILKKCGRGAAKKQLPPEAFGLEPIKAESLLSGYLSADGHFVSRHQRWVASSVSRSLLLGMAILAQRSRGVVASVYAGRPPGRKIIEGLDCNTLQDWVLGIPPRNLSGMILDDGAWKKVRNVQPDGRDEVWDLEVEEDHSYVAEGCVVHNCHPLQLDVIERCVVLWSNPGEVVLSPFAGVGSEIAGAVMNDRRGIGCELKSSYYRQSVQNLAWVVEQKKADKPIQTDLLDCLGEDAELQEVES